MGMLNWIFDIYQHQQIERTRDEISQARNDMASMRAPDQSLDMERLERAIGELALATKTVQRILIEKGICDYQEFSSMMRQIDLEDGRADGQAPVR